MFSEEILSLETGQTHVCIELVGLSMLRTRGFGQFDATTLMTQHQQHKANSIVLFSLQYNLFS
jgi:hypothetical protein